MATLTLDSLLQRLGESLTLDSIALWRAADGSWQRMARAGRDEKTPLDLLAAALDRDAPQVQGRWCALPLSAREAPGLLLAVSASRLPDAAVWRIVTASLLSAVQVWEESQQQTRRLARLESLLQLTATWNRTGQLDELLKEMAAAAARLLAAERASIFLWDERSRELVGRPALGVPGGELRVPDDQGVVGEVLKTGRPVRVSEAHGSGSINRTVDQQLQFRTRNLVGVPLTGSRGQRFGVFEVLNRQSGEFSADDEGALLELAVHAAAAIETSQQFQRLVESRRQVVQEAAGGVRLLGDCPAIQRLRETISRVAATDLSVLVLGENGTGKDVVSRLIHYGSSRRHEPLVAVNCAALPESLLESELFGHERGAFTDAREARAGKFELASRGTLFLDEIGDLSLAGQAKLLRVLEDKLVTRVGGTTTRPTDARVVAATNQNLVELVRARRFREDLYFRLHVVTLEMPPLRTRGADILLLADHFLSDFAGKARRQPPRLTDAARELLCQHPWPGNVRELRNLTERLAFLCPDEQIDRATLATLLSPPTRSSLTSAEPVDSGQSLAEATAEFQIETIRRRIAAHGRNMTLVAESLGVDRANLYRKMRQLGMAQESEK